jgi:hypothetical protein
MRTVRKHRADHPKMAPKLPVLHLKKRTIRPQPADRPCCADCPASPCGLSAKPCATKSTPPNGLKRRTRTHEELDELLVESLLVDRPPRAHQRRLVAPSIIEYPLRVSSRTDELFLQDDLKKFASEPPSQSRRSRGPRGGKSQGQVAA